MSGEFKAVARRVIDAPVAEVYAALVDVGAFAEWVGLGSPCRADIRVGGEFHIDMKCGDAAPLPHYGKFLRLVAPKLMEFTWNSDYTNGESIVRIELTPQGEKTLFLLTHSGLPDAANAADHEAGWNEMAGTFEKGVTQRAVGA